MAARFLVRHQRRPDLVRIEIVAVLVKQRLRIGFHQPRRETLADQSALPVAAIGIEAVSDHALAVAHDIGDDGNEARRHLREIDIGVANGRGDRLCNLSDIDNADGHGGFGFRRMAGFSAPSSRRAIATKQSILLLVMQ